MKLDAIFAVYAMLKLYNGIIRYINSEVAVIDADHAGNVYVYV